MRIWGRSMSCLTGSREGIEVKIPSARPADIRTLSDAEFDAELEKGYADIKAGRTKSVGSVFSDIRKDYGI